MVVIDVVFGKSSAFAVFEPFLAHLVAADVEVPYSFWHAAETDRLGFVDPDGVLRVTDLLDYAR